MPAADDETASPADGAAPAPAPPAAPASTDPASTRPKPHTVTELRLALVCYGGVSLAIYMHGVTKELHKLVVASRRFDELGPAAANPFDARTDSEHAYFETLGDLARERVLLSVNIDVLAGTSAGGINGVCLAKVLARNGSQDSLKRLWINEGDLTKLLHAPAVGGWRTRAAWAVARTLTRLRQPVSPLRGERMSQLLYDAISDMDAPVDPDRRSLLLPATPLDLFVTTTDLDGAVILVASGSGGASQRETNHAQVVQFRSSSGADDVFGPESVGALSFAARATSSFPGAFPPVSLASFQDEIGARALDAESVALMFRRGYPDAEAARRTWFVDGGVLDNAPFDLVVEAIAEKRARTEIVRRLVYIQPDPGVRLTDQDEQPDAGPSAPGYLQSLVRSVAGVKGSHSILRDLEDLRDLNLRISELGAIAAQQMDQVTAAIDQAWATTAGAAAGVWNIDRPDDVKQLADSMYGTAPQFAGATFTTYCRLKVEAAGERLADEIVTRFVYPPGSSRTSFVRAALAAWARGRVEWKQPDPARLLEMLGPVDVPYRERRLMFILAGVNALYPQVDSGAGTPRRTELDALKSRAWELLDELHDAPRAAVGAVTDSIVAFLGSGLTDDVVFDSPEAFAATHDADFTQLFMTYRKSLAEQLADSSVPMWEAFAEQTRDWAPDTRRGLLSRYLGFPLWDALIFPTVALSQLPQFTPITVSQFSPLAALALSTPDGGKLKGVSLHHFGGFVDASWRENDYLWGRLDAVELILRLLRSTTGPTVTPLDAAQAAAQAGPQLRPALAAVLASENDLTRIADVRQEVARQVAALS